MAGILSKQHIIAKPGFNRWLIVPAALGIHLCIGSVYAWSIFNPALVKQVGVVVSAADDWSLKSVVWIFTVSIVFLGLAAAIAGRWLEQVGPRMVGVVSACCWGGGFIIGGMSVSLPTSYGCCTLVTGCWAVAAWAWVMCHPSAR